MKRNDLSSLVRLRRQREQKAMNALVASQHRLRHAEGELAGATEAAAEHMRRSRDQERERLAGLVGQELRAGQIATLQSSFNAVADRHKLLSRTVERAEKAHQDRRGEVEAARGEFGKRHRQAEKLVLLQTRLKAKASRRELAIDETMTDELAGATPTAGTPAISRGE